MDVVLIFISWLILLVPRFDDSVPVTADKTFKIESSSDMIQSIATRSDETLDFWGFDIELKQNSTGILEIKIPKNLPTPASFTNSWHNGENPIILTDGTEIGYDVISDPCYSHYKIPVEDETNLEIIYTVILTGSWQLYSPTQFDENHPCYNKVFYEQPLESPLQQFKSGIPLDEIQCKENLVLLQKYDGSPACVMEQTKAKLIERGWTTDKIVASNKPTEHNNFVLYVSNQSFDNNLVDISVRIDDKLVIYRTFDVGNNHNFYDYGFSLVNGTHTISAKLIDGNVTLEKEFEIAEKQWGYLAFFTENTEPSFEFSLSDSAFEFE